MDGGINLEIKNSLAIVTLDRPDKLNSVTREMLDRFSETMEDLYNSEEILAIIITGAGDKSFSAGFDLEMIKGLEGEDYKRFFKDLEVIIRKIRENRNSITIAAVNGYCFGFGAMVAGACDFRFFAENAFYCLPEIDLDIFPGAGAASNLIHLVGPARAKDILMSGRRVQSDECLRIGLADRVLKQEQVVDDAITYAKLLIKKNTKILRAVKSCVIEMTGQDVIQADDIEGKYLDVWLELD